MVAGMNVLGKGWPKVLKGFFDRKVTFQASLEVQTESGMQISTWADVEGYVDVDCVIGDSMLKEQSNLGAKHPRTVILLAGRHDIIDTNMRAIIDGKPYRIEERTPNQSDDVTEIPVSRWE